MKNGFSMYNRGKQLKKSLIDPKRVKEYLTKLESEKEAANYVKEQQKREMMPDHMISLEDQSETSSLHFMQVMPMPKIPDPVPRLGDPDLLFLQDNHIDEDKQWRLMMDYFKKNPTALMDAIPTPPGQEEDDEALGDFKTGLTPKRGKAFKFGGDRILNRPCYEDDQVFATRSCSQMSAKRIKPKAYE